MKPTLALLALILSTLALGFSSIQQDDQQDDEEAQEAREEAFSELLTGARLVGWFTDSLRPDATPSKDVYTISRAEPADDGKWLFEAVVGENGLKVPLYLPVKWAGDSLVITLDQFPVPQMGTFDARVLFHGNSYAGVWSGDKHAGEMMGRIEK